MSKVYIFDKLMKKGLNEKCRNFSDDMRGERRVLLLPEFEEGAFSMVCIGR